MYTSRATFIPNLIFFTISLSDCQNLQWWLVLVWLWREIPKSPFGTPKFLVCFKTVAELRGLNSATVLKHKTIFSGDKCRILIVVFRHSWVELKPSLLYTMTPTIHR